MNKYFFYVFKGVNNANQISQNITFRIAEANIDYPILKILPERAETLRVYAPRNFFWRIRATALFSGDGRTTTFDLPLPLQESPDFNKKTTFDETDGIAFVRINNVFTTRFRLDYTTNRIIFETAPPSGTNNIRVDYLFKPPSDLVFPANITYSFVEDKTKITKRIVETQIETLNFTKWTAVKRLRDIEDQINNAIGETEGILLSKENEGTLEFNVNIPVKRDVVFVDGLMLDLMLGIFVEG